VRQFHRRLGYSRIHDRFDDPAEAHGHRDASRPGGGGAHEIEQRLAHPKGGVGVPDLERLPVQQRKRHRRMRKVLAQSIAALSLASASPCDDLISSG
jgi:hypothetical protein